MTDWKSRLEQPLRVAGVGDLPANWRRTVLELVCLRPADLEEGPWLEAALRGAIGRELLVHAGLREVEMARSLLFEHQTDVKRGFAVPPPWTPAIEIQARTLRLRVTLFGAGEICRDVVREALIRAARKGIALTERGSCRPSLDILDGRWWRSEAVVPPPPSSEAELHFRTPLCLNAGGPFKADPENLVFALLDRVSGLARWQGLRLDTDWGGWRDLAKGLDF